MKNKIKGTNGQSGTGACGWAKSHGDKLGAVGQAERERHWFWQA